MRRSRRPPPGSSRAFSSTPRRSSSRPTTSATRTRASSTRRARTSSTERCSRSPAGTTMGGATRRAAWTCCSTSASSSNAMNELTVRDLAPEQLRGKRALVRVDFNVPLDADRHITDDTRIRAAIPTLELLLDRGARVVLLSHLGRPKGKPEAKYSLQPVAKRLAELLPNRKVSFVESTDSDEALKATMDLVDGEVLLLENTRFLGGEETNDERLSRALAELGDLYVNDAFGAAHRAHASTEGVAKHLAPAVARLLMEKKINYLHNALENPKRPFVAVLGGSKISGKIDVIEALLPKVDALLVGGAMACTFYKAMGLETGKSLVEPDRVEMARALIEKSGTRIILPHDCVVAPDIEAGARAHAVPKGRKPPAERGPRV